MRAFTRSFFNASPLCFAVVIALVLARIVYGYWVWQSLGGYLVTGLEDAELRLGLIGFFQELELVPLQHGLPAVVVAFAAAEQAVDDLLLSPLVLGSVCVAIWMIALFGMTCELFPQAKEAGIVTLLLVAFSAVLTWSSLCTDAMPLALAWSTCCLWMFLAWQRTRLPMVLLGSAFCFCLAMLVSVDCWIFLVPFWIVAAIHSLMTRRARELPLLAGVLVFCGALAFFAAWLVFVRAKFHDPGQRIFALLEFEDSSLWSVFVTFVLGSPLLALALPMAVVGSTIRDRGQLPVARTLLFSLAILLYSVHQRPDPAHAPQRLFYGFSFLAPLIGGGTVAAIRAVCKRPAKALAVVWIVCLANAAFSFSRAFHYQQTHASLLEIGTGLSDLIAEGLLEDNGNALVERRVQQDPKVSREQRAAAAAASLAQLANPSRIHAESLTPAAGVKEADFDNVAKKNSKRYRQRHYRVVVSLSPLSTRLMTARDDYQLVGTHGPFSFLVDSNYDELARRVTRMMENLEAPLDFAEKKTRGAREPRQRPERPQRERPQRRQRPRQQDG